MLCCWQWGKKLQLVALGKCKQFCVRRALAYFMGTGLRVSVCIKGERERERKRVRRVAGMNSWADHRARWRTGTCLSLWDCIGCFSWLLLFPLEFSPCFDFPGRQTGVCVCMCVCLTCLKSHLGCNQAKQIWVLGVRPMCQVFVTFGKFKVCQLADKQQQQNWHIPQRLGCV